MKVQVEIEFSDEQLLAIGHEMGWAEPADAAMVKHWALSSVLGCLQGVVANYVNGVDPEYVWR